MAGPRTETAATNRIIPYGYHDLDESDVDAVLETLRGGLLTQGPMVPRFERAVADHVGARHAVAMCNGTSALHAACIAAGVRAGDAVVTSANTFVASANCALYVGASPRFCDIDEATLNMDPRSLIAQCDAGRVTAVVPVHFGGLPCDMSSIRSAARDAGAAVIEDAAHAFGARYADGSRVGSCSDSDMTVFSLHPVKTFTTGEGGIVTTNDDRLCARLLRLRNHGIAHHGERFMDESAAFTAGEPNPWYYEMQEVGFNYRMTDFQAALGLSQLGRVNQFVARRRELAARYDAAWCNHPVIRPAQPSGRDRSAMHLYVVRIRFDRIGMTRARLMKALAADGVGTQVHYIPLHFHPAHSTGAHDALPAAERWYEEALTIPLFYSLSDEDQQHVISTIGKYVG